MKLLDHNIMETEYYWQNVTGSGNDHCSCGSWKEHWMNFSNESWPNRCRVSGCLSAAVYGIHIKTSSKSGEYIIPGCSECNKKEDLFLIRDTKLVSTRLDNTCKKKV